MSEVKTDSVTVGPGYAVAAIADLGEQYGFLKIRRGLDVKAFGVNAIAIPAGYETGRHYHEIQEELYFIHQGEIEMEFGDDSIHRLGPGGVARVDAATIRKVRNVGEGDAVYLVVGGKDGYVGRDGKLPEGEESSFGSAGKPGSSIPNL